MEPNNVNNLGLSVKMTAYVEDKKAEDPLQKLVMDKLNKNKKAEEKKVETNENAASDEKTPRSGSNSPTIAESPPPIQKVPSSIPVSAPKRPSQGSPKKPETKKVVPAPLDINSVAQVVNQPGTKSMVFRVYPFPADGHLQLPLSLCYSCIKVNQNLADQLHWAKKLNEKNDGKRPRMEVENSMEK